LNTFIYTDFIPVIKYIKNGMMENTSKSEEKRKKKMRQNEATKGKCRKKNEST